MKYSVPNELNFIVSIRFLASNSAKADRIMFPEHANTISLNLEISEIDNFVIKFISLMHFSEYKTNPNNYQMQ